MTSYSNYERAKCAIWFDDSRSATLVQRKFRKEFGKNSPVPCAASIKKWHGSLLTNGSVQDARRQRERPVTLRREDEVLEHFQDNPHSSLRNAAAIMDNISHESVRSVLKSHCWHPYKMQTVQQLYDEDFASRLEFAAQQLELIEATDFLHKITFSDEANFHLCGSVNRHNFRYWAPTNPHWFRQFPLQSPKTTVWAAIGSNGVFGPFFHDETVNSDRYLSMLQNQFWPAVEQRNLTNDMIFMHDGAPPHWGRNVREWLNGKFPNRWIGRGSQNLPWPARSPDITPCDYFLWGFVKSKVYVTEPESMDELKQRITQCIHEIPADMISRVVQEYPSRLRQMTRNGGRHVEVEILDI